MMTAPAPAPRPAAPAPRPGPVAPKVPPAPKAPVAPAAPKVQIVKPPAAPVRPPAAPARPGYVAPPMVVVHEQPVYNPWMVGAVVAQQRQRPAPDSDPAWSIGVVVGVVLVLALLAAFAVWALRRP